VQPHLGVTQVVVPVQVGELVGGDVANHLRDLGVAVQVESRANLYTSFSLYRLQGLKPGACKPWVKWIILAQPRLRARQQQHGKQHAAVAHQEADDAGGSHGRRRGPVLVQPAERHDERGGHGDGFQQQEGDEVAVVLLADTVTHPRAVVVEAVHALVGHAAVLGAPRLDELARCSGTSCI
jgi:hypothetical protein